MSDPSTISVPAGRPAVQALQRAVAEAKQGDPLAPVTVAVPSPYSGLSLRRLLAGGVLEADASPHPHPATSGIANVRLLVAARITELLGAPALAAAGRRPLAAAVLAEAIRSVLASAPGIFAAVADHPSTERSLDRALSELRRADDAALRRLGAESPRAAEVVRLYRAVRARVEGDWYDEVDLLQSATAAVRAGSPALADLGRLIVFCPGPDDHDAHTLAEAFGAHATVILGELDPAPVGTRVISVSDADEEVRTVARELTALVRAGTPLHRIAIAYPSRRYGPLLHQHLDAAGIAHNGPGVGTLGHTITGATLLGLLSMADHDLRRDEVMGWLANGPIVDPSTGSEVPAAQWDIESRKAGVVGGVRQWDDRLAAHHEALVARRQEQVDADGPDPEGSHPQYLDRSIERLARLRTFIADLARVVQEGGRTTWTRHASWAVTQLERYLGPDSSHGSWPDADRASWTTVCRSLERLARLDAFGIAADQATFRRAVERELSRPAERIGAFGDGVFVAPLRSMAGVDVDAVFVVGLAEGVLPGASADDALLPERERAAAGPSLQRPDRLHDQHQWFLTALAAARHHRVLLYPRADLRRGRVHLPSRWLLDTASHLIGGLVWTDDLERLSTPGSPVEVVPSFAAGLLGTVEPGSLLDHDLSRLLRWERRGGRPLDHPLAEERPRLGAGLRATAARASAAFTAFDGNVTPNGLSLLSPDAPMSPTSLETWATCPRKYLLGRLLRVGAVNRPEEIEGISPADRGSLVHRVLEIYIAAVIDGAPRTLDALLATAEHTFAEYEARGLTGRPLRWRYDRQLMKRELRQFHALDDLTPVATELGFGPDTEVPVEIALDGHRTLSFKGRIDRVDHDVDGSLVVTDYKTGKSPSYRDVTKTTVSRGTRLQLPLYALAARRWHGTPDAKVRTRYWFVSEVANFEEIGFDLTDDRLATFTDVVSTAVDGISGGNFPARPGEAVTYPGVNSFDNCRYCDFHKLCPTERARQWENKRTVPELRAYVQLAEGDDDEGTNDEAHP